MAGEGLLSPTTGFLKGTGTSAQLDALITATPAELSAVSAASAGVDGLSTYRTARATYDFAEHGGTIGAIGLGVTIPDNAIVTKAYYDVLTTCTSAGADAGTGAISVEGANDIVTATAISAGGNVWDAGIHAAIPDGAAANMVKTSAAREITFTIASQNFTDGKFVVFIEYVQSA